MVATASSVDLLLTSLADADVRLSLRGVRLVVDAPDGALTPDLVDCIREHRSELMHIVRLQGPCMGCGSTEFRDFPVHQGISSRRDCATCKRTQGFPVWCGQWEGEQ